MNRREALLAGLGAALTPFVHVPVVGDVATIHPHGILPPIGAPYPLDATAAKRIFNAMKLVRCAKAVTVFNSQGDVVKTTIDYELSQRFYCATGT